jgi:hypothetical protein
MSFIIKVFTIKRNLVFMNNFFYHKLAVASICTALGFAIGANEEAKAATFTLTPTTRSVVGDSNFDELGDWLFGDVVDAGLPLTVWVSENLGEFRALYEFNIANLSLAPNTVISSALFQAKVNTISISGNISPDHYSSDSHVNTIPQYGFDFPVYLYGYTGNGQADVSDFEAGEYLNLDTAKLASQILSFDVSPFINQKISNNDAFAGFGVRIGGGYITLDQNASLTITTVDVAEPVPEPTTIFGSAIGLYLGGWLKRKKSSQQNKIAPQR